jgi:hypothetical protein
MEDERIQIWFRDPRRFLLADRASEFLPLPSMTYEQKLNAIMRFAAYLAVLLFLVNGGTDPKVFYMLLLAGLGTYALQLVKEKDEREKFDKMKRENLRFDRRKQEPCTMPTKDNPFANILPTDYGDNPDRKPGCDITRKKTKRMAEALFNHNLYMDVDDVWSRRTSSRSFYQTPIQTIPNKQTEFAKWLYGTPKRTCKEGNGQQCLMNQM